MILNYLNWTSHGQTVGPSAINAGAFIPTGVWPPSMSGPYFLPDTNDVMGYNWRSAHY